MAVTSVTYSGNGVTRDFAIGFSYTSRSFVSCYVGGVITGAWSFLNATTVRFTVAPPAGTNNIEIRRVTSTTPLADFVGAATITDTDLDLNFLQLNHVLEENQNNSLVGMQQSGGNWDATNDRLVSLATPLASTDAATKGYVDSVIGSVADAALEADAAALSAAEALAQAGAAAASAAASAASAAAADASADSIVAAIPVSGLTAFEVPVAISATAYDAIPMRIYPVSATQSAAAQAQVDVVLPVTFSEYLLELYDILPSVDGDDLLVRFSVDGGSTFPSGADYNYARTQKLNTGNADNGSAGSTSIPIAGGLDSTRYSRIASIRIFMGDGSAKRNGVLATGMVNTNATEVGNFLTVGEYEGAFTRATHIRILASTGNITLAGRLYGVVR